MQVGNDFECFPQWDMYKLWNEYCPPPAIIHIYILCLLLSFVQGSLF